MLALFLAGVKGLRAYRPVGTEMVIQWRRSNCWRDPHWAKAARGLQFMSRRSSAHVLFFLICQSAVSLIGP